MPPANKDKFEKLFKELFEPLTRFAMKYVPDLDEAKNLVHEVFINVWEKFESFPSDMNHKSYLYTSVRNRCLNHIRSGKKHVALEDSPEQMQPESGELELQELEMQVEMAINSLPEKCRMIFELSRYEGLKYSQIAEKMGISVKTVEGQMTKALGILRRELARFLTLMLFFMSV
ncbi:MAG: RNA polymerase sigma-70 factor [Cyclobacteriaceae bacterium]